MISDETPPIRLRLTQIELERFKAAFKPQPIEFRAFNVIIGRNGAGKSTLLEALQWIDTALRRDIRQACAPYNGVRDLVNLRSRSKVRFFRVALAGTHPPTSNARVQYDLKVRESEDGTRPEVETEHLSYSIDSSSRISFPQRMGSASSCLPGSKRRTVLRIPIAWP